MGMFDEEKLGVPAISFKGARKGTTVEGTILPIFKLNPRTGVVDALSYREDQDTDNEGKPRFFPSGDPILVGQVLLQTKLSGWDLTSAKFEERTADFPDEIDTGLRRWFIGSKYATQAVRAAKKTLRTAPEVGGLWTIKILAVKTGKTGSGEDYTYPDLEVRWHPATPEGQEIAAKYAETADRPAAPSEMSEGQDEAPSF